MTALLAPRPGRESTRKPRLRALDAPKRRVATVPFVLTLAAILALGMVGMIVLVTALQEQGLAVQSRQHDATVLANRVSQLQAQVGDARSIKNLAVAAQGLGMKPDPYAVAMRLSDGKTFGSSRPVQGNEMPDVRYLTEEQAAAQMAAWRQAEADRNAQQKAAAAAKKAEAAAKKAAAAATAAAAKKAEAEATAAATKKAADQAKKAKADGTKPNGTHR
jgi:hypothetical protein